jgi:hypothetical protein
MNPDDDGYLWEDIPHEDSSSYHPDAEHEIDSQCDKDDDDFEDNMTDVEADADTFRSCGQGTDEDYGYFGGDDF